MMSEKKKSVAEAGMGYCPFSLFVESRYSRLYRDIGRVTGAHGQAGHSHDTVEHACEASKQPRYGIRHGQPACGVLRQRARMALPEVSHDTMVCIVAWGNLCVAIGVAIQAAIRRPMPCNKEQGRCDTRCTALDTARGKGWGRDTIFVS